jgi:hypothetical protein
MNGGVDLAAERKGFEHGLGRAGRRIGQRHRFGGVLRAGIALSGDRAVTGELGEQGGQCLGLGFECRQTGGFRFS